MPSRNGDQGNQLERTRVPRRRGRSPANAKKGEGVRRRASLTALHSSGPVQSPPLSPSQQRGHIQPCPLRPWSPPKFRQASRPLPTTRRDLVHFRANIKFRQPTRVPPRSMQSCHPTLHPALLSPALPARDIHASLSVSR